jgi:gamma-glutamyl hydrolase
MALSWTLVLLLVAYAHGSALPVIGVLSVPIPESMECETFFSRDPPDPPDGVGSCFTAYYVKWLEQSGMRVAPIPYDLPDADLKTLFSHLNGVLFTGGGLSLWPNTTYYKTAQKIYDMTLAANAAGDYFPLWGTCQGFQMLSILTANDTSVLEISAFDSENLPLALDVTPLAAASRMFAAAPDSVMHTLTKVNSTENLHHDGVTPDTFVSNARLAAFFNVLSTNKDRKGRAFVSTMEAKHVPVYGVQWHPERNQYEYDASMHLDKTPSAFAAMQYMSSFLASETRKSTRKFPSDSSEYESLIYKYPARWAGGADQFYFFNPANSSARAQSRPAAVLLAE